MNFRSVTRARLSKHGVVLRCIALIGVLTACPGAQALNPALDVSQYAHSTWKAGGDLFKGAVHAVTQTSDGFLWLGTEFGLFRFDGVKSVPWPVGDLLPSSQIRTLLESRDGTLWVGTSRGLVSLKDHNSGVTVYPQLAGHTIMALIQDREGAVWAGGWVPDGGRLCRIQNARAIQCYGGEIGLGRAVSNLYESKNGDLWAGVTDGLLRLKPAPGKLYPSPEKGTIQGLAEEDDGSLLIPMGSAIKRLAGSKIEDGYQLPAAVRGFEIRGLLRDRDGGLWIGTSPRGLVHIHQGRTDVFDRSDGLSGDDVSALFEDREGNVWVATLNGLDCFHDSAISTFTTAQGLSSDRVVSVLAARDGSIWIRTFDGLNRWHNGHVTIYREGSSGLAGVSSKRAGPLAPVHEVSGSGVPGQGPGSLFQDSSGRIWVSSVRSVSYLDNDRFISVPGIPGGRVHAITGDIAGNLWFADENGLSHLRPDHSAQQTPWTEMGHVDFADALAFDPIQGGLWLGFFHGGVAYFKDGKVQAFYTSAGGLGEGRVNDFRLDRDGTLWAATEGGLSRLKDGRAATITTKNGLPCNAVHWAMEDDAHSFWLYMTCGLIRIGRSDLDAWVAAVDKNTRPLPSLRTTSFDISDGLRSRANAGGWGPHVDRSPDGKLWFFPLDNGLNVLDPNRLDINKPPPPVQIEEVTADRNTYRLTSGPKDPLHLPPLIRDLEIDYTALNLVAPEKVRFRYKLDGKDRDWRDAGERRQAFYDDLSPGNYRFHVSASNDSGVGNAGTFVDFSVAPAYYQTNLFRLSCAAAFAALMCAIYRLWRRQVEQHFNARLQERVRERTRIAQELHDTLLQNVAGLCLQIGGLAKTVTSAPESARERLKALREQGEECLREARRAVWNIRSLESESLDLATELRECGNRLTAGTGIRFTFCVEGEPRRIPLDLREQVLRIGQEAIANATRHAHAVEIEVRVIFEAEAFRLRIVDNGRGFSQEAASAVPGHFGLITMRERAQEIRASIVISSEAQRGTRIEVIVPGPT